MMEIADVIEIIIIIRNKHRAINSRNTNNRNN